MQSRDKMLGFHASTKSSFPRHAPAPGLMARGSATSSATFQTTMLPPLQLNKSKKRPLEASFVRPIRRPPFDPTMLPPLQPDNSKKRLSETSHFRPIKRARADFQYEHLQFAEISAKKWWPCLAFGNVDTMMQVHRGLFPDQNDTRNQMTLDMYAHCWETPHLKLEDVDVLVALGNLDGPKSYYNIERMSRLNFSDTAFFSKLAELSFKANEDPQLMQSMLLFKELLTSMGSKAPAMTVPVAQPLLTTQTALVATKPTTAQVPSPDPRDTATMVSLQTEDESNKQGIKMPAIKNGPKSSAKATPAEHVTPGEEAAIETDNHTANDSDFPATTDNETDSGSSTQRKSKRKKGITSAPNREPSVSRRAPKNIRKLPLLYKSTGETLYVPSWDKVRPLFLAANYVFNDDHYCKPLGDPRVNRDAKLGEHYFESLTTFRSYLCANGVDHVVNLWDDEESEVIEMWVRYSILSHNKRSRPEELHTDKTKGLKLIKMLGIKYKTSLLKDGYVLPGTQNILNEEELWLHLARHGLPKQCTFERIDTMHLLALELCIAKNVKFELWPREREVPPPQDFPAKPTASQPKSSEQTDEESLASPVVKKALLQGDTRRKETAYCDKDPTSTLNGRGESPAMDRAAWQALNRAPDDETRSPISQMKLGQTPLGGRERPAMEDSAVDAGTMVANGPPGANKEVPERARKKPDDSSLAAEKKSDARIEVAHDEFVEVALKGNTVRKRLLSCTNAMRKGANDKMAVAGKLSSSLSKIQSFVRAVVNSKGRNGMGCSLPVLHVCGAPGSGKSMGIKWCCDREAEWKQQNSEEWEGQPKFVHINASHLQNHSKKDALKKTLEYMGINRNQLRRPLNEEESSKAAVILVLDEIDYLVSATNSSTSSTGLEEYLRTLLNWALDENMLLGVIGISNSVENMKARRLKSLGMGQNKVVFNTYDKGDLVRILESRIGRSVVDRKTAEFLASKVSATSGDARKFLDMISRAVEICRTKLPKTILDSKPDKPVVKLPHAMMVVRETNVKYKDLIESLPLYERHTLFVGVHLSRVLGSKPLTLGILKRCCMEAFGFDPFLDPISLEDFKGIVERLGDSGLLKMADCDRRAFWQTSMGSLLSFPVRFDLQLEDVESALEETLLKESFYQRMVARLNSMNLSSI